MVTMVTLPSSGAELATPQLKPVQMSDIAEQALSKIGNLQDSMAEVSAKVDTTNAAMIDASQSATFAEMLARTGEMMALASQVQGQLLQFSVATSVSSSMGRNLSTFLKGQ